MNVLRSIKRRFGSPPDGSFARQETPEAENLSLRIDLWVVANVGAAAVLLATQTEWRFTLVLMLWLNLMLYACVRATQRAFLLAFLISFFVFLLGRETVVRVFGYERSAQALPFDGDVFEHVMLVLGLGLVSLAIGYILWGKLPQRQQVDRDVYLRSASGEDTRLVAVRGAAQLVFYCTLPGAILAAVLSARSALIHGYTQSYSAELVALEASSTLNRVANLLEVACIAALAVFLATFPSRKAVSIPLILWIATSVILLVGGARGQFVTTLLWVGCYILLRAGLDPEAGWIKRRWIVVALISLPILVLVLAAVESWRGLGAGAVGSIGETFLSFFYGQGVSAAVVGNAYRFQDLIPEQQYLLEFTRSGIAPRIFGFEVLQGNSIERAQEGGSLAHSLSWATLGPEYLDGRGTGSSYLAEAWMDFGYPGVAVVGAIYGVILASMDRLGHGGIVINSVRLVIASAILWAPRGSATGFLTQLFAPAALAAFALIAVLGLVFASERVRSLGARRGQR